MNKEFLFEVIINAFAVIVGTWIGLWWNGLLP